MIEIDQSQFQNEVIEASHQQLVLVDFWAPWCGPCRMLGPVLEQAEARAGGRVKLVKINSDENPQLSAQFGVRSIPFVMAFSGGRPVDQFVGALPLGQVEAFIAKCQPRPGADQVSAGLAALADGRYQQAAQSLTQALAQDSGNTELRVDTVRAMLHAGTPGVEEAFQPIAAQAATDKRIAALALLVAAGAEPAPVSDLPADRAIAAAGQALLAADWPAAMAAALEAVRADRGHREELGRRLMLAAFEFCPDKALVSAYRRQLAASLN
ncbi:MAG: thioredoxin [Burkholderiaceae bacterium]